MDDTETRSLEASQFGSWAGAGDARLAHAAVPRLRVLYHVDLARVGAASHPDGAFEAGEWLTVGRRGPLFATTAAGAVWQLLEDPTVSRAQLRLRWVATDGCFEVEPLPSARLPLRLFCPTGAASPRDEAVTTATRAAPGSVLAIGDRILLGLELAHRPLLLDEDRLGFVGESEAAWRLRHDIAEIARFQRPALVLGPTGAGKELVARAIHAQGRHPDGPFRTINCAALPEHLVESLLFGHRKGAFTGAGSDQEGAFRGAAGGTLFLDELAEMPLSIQPKLLRVVQDGLVTPVGGQTPVKVDARLVAATNRQPEAEIAAGRLRADLYHRLAAHVVVVPPLSARAFDVPGLLAHFLAELAVEHPSLAWLWEGGRRWRATLALDFFVDLLRARWEGNVRELQNVAEATARMNLHPGPFRAPPLPGAASHAPPPGPRPPSEPRVEATAREGREASPHLAEASQLLGIARRTCALLFDDATLARVWREADSPEARATGLVGVGGERLYGHLRAHDFKQARVAAALEVSPWTLIRLMQRFGVPRPTDLEGDVIERALADAGGDLATAATALRVSEHGLKKRLADDASAQGRRQADPRADP